MSFPNLIYHVYVLIPKYICFDTQTFGSVKVKHNFITNVILLKIVIDGHKFTKIILTLKSMLYEC
jgi:hypothetical protein